MYLSDLDTNVKGELRVKLAPRTVIVGPNASHKSGLKAAVRLLTEGRSDEHGAVGSEIRTLAPSDAPSLFVRGVLRVPEEECLEDGPAEPIEVSYEIEGTTAKAKKPVWKPGHQIGVDLGKFILEMLAGSSRAATQREELLRAIAPREILRAALKQFGTGYHADWQKFTDSARTDIAKEEKIEVDHVLEADILVRATEDVRSALRKATADSKKTQEGTKPEAISDDEFAFLEKMKAEALALRDWFRSKAAVGLRRSILNAELKEAEEQVAAAGGPTVSADQLNRMEARAKALEVLRPILLAGKDCPLCLGKAASINLDAAVKFAKDIADRVTELRNSKTLVLKTSPGERLARLQTEAAEIEKIEKAEKPTGKAESQTEAELAYAKIDEQVRQSRISREALRLWQDQQGLTEKAAKEIPALTALKLASEASVKAVLGAEIEKFEARASQFLPGRKVGVQLFDGGRSVCRVGLREGPSVISLKNLAGEQRIACVCALAAALGQNHVETVRLVTVDDVWLEEKNVLRLCEGLGSAIGRGLTQALVFLVEMSAQAEESLKSFGWDIVRLDRPAPSRSLTTQLPLPGDI